MICCPNCWGVQNTPENSSDLCAACGYSLGVVCDKKSIRELLARWAKSATQLEIDTRSHQKAARLTRVNHDPNGFKRINLSENPSSPLAITEWDSQNNVVSVQTSNGNAGFALPCFVYDEKALFKIVAKVAFPEQNPPPISQRRNSPTSILKNQTLIVGSHSKAGLPTIHPTLEKKHALIVRSQSFGNDIWIFDLQSKAGTFVNGRRVLASVLRQGDLVQIGPFAWEVSESDGFLVPVDAIHGVKIDLKHVRVGNRLGPISLTLRPGELVAIVGGSGAGKSTLIKQIVSANPEITFDGKNASNNIVEYQKRLGYVSQKEVLHPMLGVKTALFLSRKFRLGLTFESDQERTLAVETVLRRVDLPASRWEAQLSELSGGEFRRVQLASELTNEPGLFVLDEPTSGLDTGRRRQTFQLLRSFSFRGGTVAVVTHAEEQLSNFDRVIQVSAGKIIFDGKPSRFRGIEAEEQAHRATSTQVVVSEDVTEASLETSSPSNSLEAGRPIGFLDRLYGRRSFKEQYRTHLEREWLLRKGDWLRSLIVPLLVVPLFFAISLGIAVPDSAASLMGFLCVLSTIWIGASLSLMSVVGERRIVEHERKVFLTVAPYLFAKTSILFALSLIQTTVFFIMLSVLESGNVSGQLQHQFVCLLILILCGWAATGLGLLISTLANFSRLVANFVMPLVMIAQIVFSVQVADTKPKDDLHVLYGRFTNQTCLAHPNCERKAEVWTPSNQLGSYVCSPCYRVVKTRLANIKKGEYDLPSTAVKTQGLPSSLVTRLSYLTISRYGDIALRSFAYSQPPTKWSDSKTSRFASDSQYTYACWRWDAIRMLLAMGIGFPLLSGLCLRYFNLDYER